MSPPLLAASGLAIAAVAVPLLFLIIVVAIYNGLVRRRTAVRASWGQVNVALKRRHDLVPNLVETVKGYAGHEKDVLERVVSARSQALAAAGPAKIALAESQLTRAMGGLMALAEAYPQLRAADNFRELQGALADTENQIGSARQGYNNTVNDYNAAIGVFPSMVVAAVFGFNEEPFFELTDATERQVPKVSFS